jgi:hypothetical protein
MRFSYTNKSQIEIPFPDKSHVWGVAALGSGGYVFNYKNFRLICKYATPLISTMRWRKKKLHLADVQCWNQTLKVTKGKKDISSLRVSIEPHCAAAVALCHPWVVGCHTEPLLRYPPIVASPVAEAQSCCNSKGRLSALCVSIDEQIWIQEVSPLARCVSP